MNTLKQLIKEKSERQRVLKNQRKTITLVGERTIDPQTATSSHAMNRVELKYLFISYAILRGKNPLDSVASYDPSDAWQKHYVDRNIEKYGAEFKTVSADQ